MTEQERSELKLLRGIFTKLFKYLEFKGVIYKTPFSATPEGWQEWDKQTSKKYPVIYRIREFIEDAEYDLIRKYSDIKYTIRTFLFPENKIIRESIPIRNHDIASIIPQMNFAAILQFKEEADKSMVDWDGDETQKEFKRWLDSAAIWVKEGRPNLQKALQDAYPNVSLADMQTMSGEQVKGLYFEVERLESLIAKTDENILIEMIKYRNYFWT
jgi:hypothetical protein